MILNKSKVEEAAKELVDIVGDGTGIIEGAICTIGFKAGVSYAESELSELAIEFAEWIFISPLILTDMQGGIGSNLTPKELFEIFLKERHGSDKKIT